MDGMRHVRLSVQGKVQGVWFRASAKETADQLGVKGWVKNLPEGGVEIDAWGGAEAVESFIGWCSHGPPGARVTRTDIKELGQGAGPQDFLIVR